MTDGEAVRRNIGALAVAAEEAGFAPVVVNAAAHTAVDAAETEPDMAYAVNQRDPGSWLPRARSTACR